MVSSVALLCSEFPRTKRPNGLLDSRNSKSPWLIQSHVVHLNPTVLPFFAVQHRWQDNHAINKPSKISFLLPRNANNIHKNSFISLECHPYRPFPSGASPVSPRPVTRPSHTFSICIAMLGGCSRIRDCPPSRGEGGGAVKLSCIWMYQLTTRPFYAALNCLRHLQASPCQFIRLYVHLITRTQPVSIQLCILDTRSGFWTWPISRHHHTTMSEWRFDGWRSRRCDEILWGV